MAAPFRRLGGRCLSALHQAVLFASFKGVHGVSVCSVLYKENNERLTADNRRRFHTSQPRKALEEFFDNPDNAELEIVKCGRPWKLEELRIKSNEDLHKLWYVLLKEYNMLLTMEAEYERSCELMPSPDRLEKVEESMDNLLDVIGERDRAYHLLEDGVTGEPEPYVEQNVLGEKYLRTPKEYPIPKHMTRYFKLKQQTLGPWTYPYLRKQRENQHKRETFARERQKRKLKQLREAFPDADIQLEDVQEQEKLGMEP